MSKTLSLPNLFFEEVAEQLLAGNMVDVTVNGESMYPFLHSGDTISLRPYKGEELPEYCCLFYKWQNHYMTHRLISKSGTDYILFGDGNIYRYEKIHQSDIIGVLVSASSKHKIIDCYSSSWFNKGKWWYRLRHFRKYLIKILRIINY